MIAVFSGFWAKGNNINLESRNFQPFLSVFVRTMATACDAAGRSKVSLTLTELPNTIFHQCHHLLPLAATPMSVSLRGRRRWIGSSEFQLLFQVIPISSCLVLSTTAANSYPPPTDRPNAHAHARTLLIKGCPGYEQMILRRTESSLKPDGAIA